MIKKVSEPCLSTGEHTRAAHQLYSVNIQKGQNSVFPVPIKKFRNYDSILTIKALISDWLSFINCKSMPANFEKLASEKFDCLNL